MSDEKSEKISISLPGDVLLALDAHVTAIRESRSGWIQSLAIRELTAAGLLKDSDGQRGELIAAAEEIGIDRALAVLKRARRKEAA